MGFRLTEQDLAWQDRHYNDTRVPGLIATYVSATITSVIILALRLISRRLQYGLLRLGVSDWLVLVAWVFFAIMIICWFIGTRYGIGRHAVVITNVHIVEMLVVVCEASYILSTAFTKLSVLALYFRAFPSRRFRYCVWGLTLIVVGWAMAGAVLAVFQCISIDYVWRSEFRDLCIDSGLRHLVLGTIDTMLDFIILTMVLPLVWNQISSNQRRWSIIVVLVVGSSACVLSIVYLHYSIKLSANDKTWDYAHIIILGLVKITVGMLAVSMPTYRPLYEHTVKEGAYGDKQDPRVNRHKESLHMDFGIGESQNDVNVTSPGGHMVPDHGGINVTNHIELVRHTNKSGSWVRVMDDDDEELYQAPERTDPKAHRDSISRMTTK